MDKKQKKIVIILITALVLIDQIIKIVFFVTGAKIGYIEGINLGIINNTKSENNLQYILIYIIAISSLIRYINKNNTYINLTTRIVISFAIAGCISNLIDRIWNGFTINYINIPNFISLNLGYIFIAVTWIGMACILTKYTADRIKERKKYKNGNNCERK